MNIYFLKFGYLLYHKNLKKQIFLEICNFNREHYKISSLLFYSLNQAILDINL